MGWFILRFYFSPSCTHNWMLCVWHFWVIASSYYLSQCNFATADPARCFGKRAQQTFSVMPLMMIRFVDQACVCSVQYAVVHPCLACTKECFRTRKASSVWCGDAFRLPYAWRSKEDRGVYFVCIRWQQFHVPLICTAMNVLPCRFADLPAKTFGYKRKISERKHPSFAPHVLRKRNEFSLRVE